MNSASTKCSDTELAEIREINRALPFAEPIALLNQSDEVAAWAWKHLDVELLPWQLRILDCWLEGTTPFIVHNRPNGKEYLRHLVAQWEQATRG